MSPCSREAPFSLRNLCRRPCVRTSTVLILLVGALHAVPQSPAAQTAQPDSAVVISRLRSRYAAMTSAEGEVARTASDSDGGNTTTSGTFALQRPSSVLFDFTEPMERVILFDGQSLRVYYPDSRRGIFRNVADMSPYEEFLLGPNPYFGDYTRIEDYGYTFADITLREDGTALLTAVPDTSAAFSSITVEVDTEGWLVTGVEHFAPDGRLVSRTVIEDYHRVGERLLFPHSITTTTHLDDGVTMERFIFSSIRLNRPIPDRVFHPPFDPHAEWIPESEVLGGETAE